MTAVLILGSILIILCIAAGNVLYRFGMPALIIFLLLGLIAGSFGPLGDMHFDNYHIAEQICSVALVFIIFYGGFGTNWKTARPVVVESVLFSTVGVLITAGAVMVFVHFTLLLSWAESFLIGSVVSCIDAASIFSILRTKKLALKFNTASVLEIEGGCNDLPASILTVVAIIVLNGESAGGIGLNVLSQLLFGVLIGIVTAILVIWILKRVGHRLLEGMNLLLVIAVAILSYSASVALGGNGYLAVYLTGIMLGNAKIPKRSNIVNMFDTIDWLAQIIIFFLLGFLANPFALPAAVLPALALTAFLTFIARPLSVFAIFPWFKNFTVGKGLFISWAGIRGAASIVFVFLALASGVELSSDLFSLIFIVALLSISIQGTLFPFMARKCNMIDEETDYHLSFNDFQQQSESSFFKMDIPEEHAFVGRPIKDIPFSGNMLIVLIKRGESTVSPRGDTVIQAGDVLVVSGESYSGDADTEINQIVIDGDHPWIDHYIKDLHMPGNSLIVSIVREDGTAITPKGWVKIHSGDYLTLFEW